MPCENQVAGKINDQLAFNRKFDELEEVSIYRQGAVCFVVPIECCACLVASLECILGVFLFWSSHFLGFAALLLPDFLFLLCQLVLLHFELRLPRPLLQQLPLFFSFFIHLFDVELLPVPFGLLLCCLVLMILWA